MGGYGRSELGFCRDHKPLLIARAPWMPCSRENVRDYVDFLKQDAEVYFASVEHYFRCRYQERRKVCEQARRQRRLSACFAK